MKKQQKAKKGRPRGRPWPKGVSGNPAGRPRGSRNKTTLAVLEGIRRAEAKLARPKVLDRSLPYNAWGDRYEQFGLVFRKDSLTLRDPQTPAIPQPAMLDPRQPRQEITWNQRHYYLQNGWPFDRRTHKAVKV